VSRLSIAPDFAPQRTVDGSQPDGNRVAPIPAPDGAPNVLLVLTDAAGVGNPSGDGGRISTPTMGPPCGRGLTYNGFHTTALCSPTRAVLMTGRNHHAAASDDQRVLRGAFPGNSTNLPNGLHVVPEDAAAKTATRSPVSASGI
jgi:hypothetical protein